MFCVVCGKETPQDELRGGECPSCYLEKNVLVELRTNVDVEVCVHCHARKRGEIWVEGHGSLIPVVQDAVREAVLFAKVVEKPRVSLDVQPEDERNFRVSVVAAGSAEGVPFEKELATRSRIKNATCVRCSRIQGGYYEAIVQIRASKRPIERNEMRQLKALASRFIERIVAEGDRNAFVLRDEEIDKGLDVYMGTTNAGRMLAKQIVNEFGAKVQEHGKTVGQKDGLDIIRLTFAVRLPEYRAGDVVILNEGPGLVSSIGPKTVQVMDLQTGKTRHVERALVERARVVPPADARDAVVVTQTATELQLLDPWTYATVPVLRPAGLDRVGATVRVLRHEGELIILPMAD